MSDKASNSKTVNDKDLDDLLNSKCDIHVKRNYYVNVKCSYFAFTYM